MKVRIAKFPEDFEKVFALNVIISPDEDRNSFEKDTQNFKGSFFVVEENERIVGFGSLSYPYWNQIGLILHLAVLEESRLKGIGTALLETIVKEAKKSKLRFVTVRTASWNLSAIKFYERCGFSQKANFENYFGDGNTMIWFDLDLR